MDPATQSATAVAGVPLSRARSRLAAQWLIGAGIIFLLLILQSVFGKYHDKAQQVWSWALPSLMPTLTLIISVLGANALEPQDEGGYVRKSFYRLAMLLSAAYLILILFTILIEPFTTFDSAQLLNLSNLWLGPFQGFVASAIGLLFFTKKRE
jgi:hypothetical protein